MRDRTQNRRLAEAAGRRAEAIAAWWLRLKGYRIVAQGFRSPLGEIDIVARRGGIVAFVEVKRRATHAGAIEAIQPRQRQRIARAARLYLQSMPALARLQPRFDAVVLVPGHRPRHLPAAWSDT
jgi:putative endonuclease